MIRGIHIELTTKCTLKCPRCSRTEFINTFGINKWSNVDLDINNLKKFLDIDLTGVTVALCGNTGDPIYHTQFIEVVQWLKSKSATLRISTNGSYKTAQWWKELSQALGVDDAIVFAIDGLPSNFIEYRINADWESIQVGIQTLVENNRRVIWKYIPFSFNERDIPEAHNLAIELGVSEFFVDPSDRWQDNDWLKPENFIGPVQTQKINWTPKTNIEINPRCLNSDQHYISANGFYSPCCYSGEWRFYYKSEFYKSRDQYDISKTTLSEIVLSNDLKNFFNDITIHPREYCTFNCPK